MTRSSAAKQKSRFYLLSGVILLTTAALLFYGSARRDAQAFSGRLKPVTVSDFSGVDPSGAVDSSTGIASAVSDGGRLVWFPCGTYLVEKRIRLPSHTKIVGAGTCTRIIESAFMQINPEQAPRLQAVRNIFANSDFVSGNTDIEIKNLTLDATQAPAGPHFIVMFYNANRIVIDGILFLANSMVNTDATAFIESFDYKIIHNRCIGARNACFDQWSNAHDFLISDNVCDGEGMRSDRCILVNGLSLNRPPGVTYNGVIAGNVVKNVSGVGIGVYGLFHKQLNYTGRVHHIEISDNTVYRTGLHGILVGEGGDILVKGNNVKDAAHTGIKIAQASLTEPTNSVIVSDNHIESNSLDPAVTAIDIGNGLVKVSNVILYNNNITGNFYSKEINIRSGVSNVCITVSETETRPRVSSVNPDAVTFRLRCGLSSQLQHVP